MSEISNNEDKQVEELFGGLFEKNKQDNKDEQVIEEKMININFFEETVQEYDDFDEYSWKKGNGFNCPNFPSIEENLEGLESGLYLLAAESNVGKSAVMMNLLYDFAKHKENKLFGIYYTLDDSTNEIIPRVIAMNKIIPISVGSKPNRYQELIDDGAENSILYSEWLEKRSDAIKELKELRQQFKIVDSTKITSLEKLKEHIKQAQIYIKTIDPEMSIIVAIDSINDLKFENSSFSTTREKHDEAAKEVKQWTVDLDIPIFAATHLRKGDGKNRPTLDMIKESIEYVYEASVVWLLHNDVSKNGQSAKVYRGIANSDEKGPVIEMDWAKNKKSSFKGRTFYYFSADHSKIVEVDKDISKQYNSLVYEL